MSSRTEDTRHCRRRSREDQTGSWLGGRRGVDGRRAATDDERDGPSSGRRCRARRFGPIAACSGRANGSSRKCSPRRCGSGQPGLQSPGRHGPLVRSPELLLDAASYLGVLYRAGVPWRRSSRIVGIKPLNRRMVTDRAGRFTEFSADRVGLHDGIGENAFGMPSEVKAGEGRTLVLRAGDCREALGGQGRGPASRGHYRHPLAFETCFDSSIADGRQDRPGFARKPR